MKVMIKGNVNFHIHVGGQGKGSEIINLQRLSFQGTQDNAMNGLKPQTMDKSRWRLNQKSDETVEYG